MNYNLLKQKQLRKLNQWQRQSTCQLRNLFSISVSINREREIEIIITNKIEIFLDNGIALNEMQKKLLRQKKNYLNDEITKKIGWK